MPRRFLSQAERQQLSQFPPLISENDLIVYFTLTPADIVIIKQQREAHNRLGFAMLLCALRYLGFFPTDIRHPPANVVTYVASQLQLPATAIADYAVRDETRREHLIGVMNHLGFRRPQETDKEQLTAWLGERTLENDRPSSLLQLACERLYQLRLVRPAVTTMEELVIDARQWAQEKTIQVLVEPLPADKRQRLSTLLEPIKGKGITPLTWLRRSAIGHSDRDILDTLAKLAFIRQWSVEKWSVDQLPPSRLKFLAQLARHTSNQGLKRKKPVEKRDAILTAFLLWAYEKTIDELIDLFDLCLADAFRKSRRELKEYQLAHVAQMQKVVEYFQEMTGILLDEAISDTDVRATVYQQVTPDVLQTTLEETQQLFISGRKVTFLDFFDRRYSYFRRFTPAFLNALTFHSPTQDNNLLKAIDVLRDLNEQEGRMPTTLEDVPITFVPARWRTRVLNKDETVNRRDYEMCVLSELRDALRSGAVWLKGSRRYADLDSYLIPKSHWPQLRTTYCEMVGIPEDGQVQISQKQADLEKRLAHFDKQLPKYEHVRLEKGRLIISPLEKEEAEVKETSLSKIISTLLPYVQSGELLAEVDAWTRFSDYLTHAGGSTSRMPNLAQHLYAVILSQACNIELRRMAELTDLSYARLVWCANWYIREETLQAVANVLVNFQYQQQLSHYWGTGIFSSSDGQRFAVARKMNRATPLPRYFGYGRGLTFLTWTSDQLSQYGTRVTPPTIRESTLVLDAILDNETDLNIQEHTTDTAGYTDLVFALFDLLGLQFSPRLRDIGGHNLYCLDASIKYKRIGPLISRPLDIDLIVENWDDLLRVAASLKMGWVTASTLISKLQAFPRQHKLTQVLQEYGRLVKTIFILHYIDDEQYRRRVLVQLNKGEAIHKLRRFLFFDNQGRLRRQQPEDLVNQAGCLNVLSNAIIVWNTVYMQAVLDDLTAREHPINEADLVHLSPARFGHINPYGKFRFDFSDYLDSSGLRPLRSS